MSSERHFVLSLALIAITLWGCGGPPPYVAPVQDPGPHDPKILTANAVLYSHPKLWSALDQADEVLRFTLARVELGEALQGIDPEGEALLIAGAALAYGEGRVEDGLLLFNLSRELGHESAHLFASHSESLLAAGLYHEAREMAYEGLDRYPEDADLDAAADRAFDEDPLLGAREAREITRHDLESIKSLGGGSTLTFKLIKDGEKIAALKPNQDLGQSMYRSEIAFYRLCALTRCAFRVPVNEHVRFSKGDFEVLYGRVDSPKQRGYKSKFSHLTYTTEGGEDYLHATAKEWVPDFTGFPIEATSTWKPWLKVTAGDRDDELVSDWLPKLADAAGPRGWNRHSKRMGYVAEMTMGFLAAQLSDLLAMDYLSNNWDRFSGDPQLYGANCHIEPGGLVAIDNGAAFPPWHTNRVTRRLKHARRFRAPFVHALRRLDHDETVERLFPNPNKDEKKRFEIFWERRTELLDYIDGLIEEHGEEAVLSL